MKGTVRMGLVVAMLHLGIPAAAPAQQPARPAPADPREACRLLIERSRMTEEGQLLLQRLMRETEAPAVMDRLIHLAKSLGGGDVMAGLSRMMETIERVERQGGAATTPGAPPGAPTK